jgi:transcriptional regulator with XRE-family HTH domain
MHRTSLPTDGAAIRHHRQLAGFTQTGFAQHLGISLGHLSKVERDKKYASPPLLKRIADAVGVTTRDLVKAKVTTA